MSPWSYHHNPVAPLGKGNGQTANYIPQAPRFAPGCNLRGYKYSVQGVVCLWRCALWLFFEVLLDLKHTEPQLEKCHA